MQSLGSIRPVLAGVLVAALAAAGADAAKPPAQPLAGTVYFQYWNGIGHLNTMSPTGGAKTALPAGVSGEPSIALHGGHRWFLQMRDIPGESYPGTCARTRREIFAQRGDGNEAFTKQLTDQSSLDASGSMRWMAGDAQISWVARRWMGGVVDHGGVYTASIQFDGSGNVVGLTAQPVSPTASVPLILWPDGSCGPACCGTFGGELGPDMRSHDWAPDGNRVVYDRLNSELWIATAVPPGESRLVTTYPARFPRWSPDSTKIVYSKYVYGGGINTILPSGSDERLIVGSSRGPGGITISVGGPSWSPTGTHVLYRWFGGVSEDTRSDVYRANADGSGKTNLTSDLDTRQMSGQAASPIGWR